MLVDRQEAAAASAAAGAGAHFLDAEAPAPEGGCCFMGAVDGEGAARAFTIF